MSLVENRLRTSSHKLVKLAKIDLFNQDKGDVCVVLADMLGLSEEDMISLTEDLDYLYETMLTKDLPEVKCIVTGMKDVTQATHLVFRHFYLSKSKLRRLSVLAEELRISKVVTCQFCNCDSFTVYNTGLPRCTSCKQQLNTTGIIEPVLKSLSFWAKSVLIDSGLVTDSYSVFARCDSNVEEIHYGINNTRLFDRLEIKFDIFSPIGGKVNTIDKTFIESLDQKNQTQ